MDAVARGSPWLRTSPWFYPWGLLWCPPEDVGPTPPCPGTWRAIRKIFVMHWKTGANTSCHGQTSSSKCNRNCFFLSFEKILFLHFPGVFLIGDIGADWESWLRTQIWLVGSEGFAIVTVDVLLEEPVALNLPQLHLHHGDLLAPGVGEGSVAVRSEEDVGRGRLFSPLWPLIPGLGSEVFSLLQSDFNV